MTNEELDRMRNAVLVHVHNGDWQAARDGFERVRQLAPSSGIPLNDLAVCSERLGDTQAAIAYSRRAVALDPKKEHLNTLGSLLRDSGETMEAIEVLTRTKKAHPGFAPAFNNLGLCFMALGKMTEAAAEFSAAVRLAPDSELYRHNLSRVTS